MRTAGSGALRTRQQVAVVPAAASKAVSKAR